MYGIPGVIQVFGVLQNSAVSALWSENSNCLCLPSVLSIEKPNFGFLARYPINIAIVFFNFVSSNPSKIFWCLRIEIMFRIKFTKRITTDSNAAFVNTVKGVTMFSENDNCGANPAKTINANASAPPNIPNLHKMRANGTIINAIAIWTENSFRFGSKKTSAIATTPKAAHKRSLISRFHRSRNDAVPSITKAMIILIWKISHTNSIS